MSKESWTIGIDASNHMSCDIDLSDNLYNLNKLSSVILPNRQTSNVSKVEHITLNSQITFLISPTFHILNSTLY